VPGYARAAAADVDTSINSFDRDRQGMVSDFSSESSPLDLTTAYVELQKMLLKSPDTSKMLDRIAELAAAVTSPPSSCGITLRRDSEVSTVAASSSLAAHADELQYAKGDGPCLHSMRNAEVVHIADMATDSRWPEYRLPAMASGIRSSLSVPLIIDEESVGALNIYTDTQHDFGQADISNARAFADQAAAALTVVMRQSEQLELEVQLRNALSTRAVIDQALGIVMAQQRCNSTDAFAVLRKASQDRNVKVAEIASELILNVTGHPPQPPRPFTRR
jgi:GAF domain-containing protein